MIIPKLNPSYKTPQQKTFPKSSAWCKKSLAEMEDVSDDIYLEIRYLQQRFILFSNLKVLRCFSEIEKDVLKYAVLSLKN